MWDLFRRRPSLPVPPRAEAKPLDLDGHDAIYAIGDVHGCLDLLLRLEARIEEDIHVQGFTDPVLLLLGDFIDRGPQSAAVIDHLIAGKTSGGIPVRAIAGNHEDAMVAFAHNPQPEQSWLVHGGVATLMSYETERRTLTEPDRNYGSALYELVPVSHLRFLRALPQAASGHGYRFQHMPPAAVGGSATVVHGHVIVPEPVVSQASINVDLGAYRFGRLCAARTVAGRPPVLIEVHRQGGQRYRPDETEAARKVS